MSFGLELLEEQKDPVMILILLRYFFIFFGWSQIVHVSAHLGRNLANSLSSAASSDSRIEQAQSWAKTIQV